jgi:N-acetylneuraminate synthase
MAQIKFNDNAIIEDYAKPYFVAEMNTSHFGKIDTAKEMIIEAKKAGCDCVKFQSWTVDSLYAQDYYDANPVAKRFVKGFSFDNTVLKELALFCETIGISFASTPYSFKEVDFLVDECKVPFIKIASMDLNNHRFLEYIGNKQVPIILSTGMGEMDEIKEAIKVLEATNNKNITILHCISIYPPEISTINLNNIIGLREAFPNYPIGFSDHSIGTEIPIASIALGAALVEKHFTLDKSKIGMDNQVATEPDEMKQLIVSANNVQQALGQKKRVVLDAELAKRDEMRRSVVVTRDMKEGETITQDDIDCKRPGTGIGAEQYTTLIGKKLIQDVKKDYLLHDEDIEA